MKKLGSIITLLVLVVKGFSQCNCTITISSINTSPWVVSTGQTLCITSTGQLVGNLLIDGGEVCNDGLITNNFVYITGGGQLINHSIGNTCDSLLVAGLHSTFINSGSFNNERMAALDSGYIHNLSEGTLHCSFFGDSITRVDNEGVFRCDSDFYNVTGAEFRNLGQLIVNRDFYNATNATVMNNCLIQVERNFYNGGVMFAHVDLPAGCIRVGGDSYNAGDLQLLSFWDSSSPTGDLDYESGTSNLLINPCTASCSVGLDELREGNPLEVYPNPCETNLTISGIKNGRELSFELINIHGQVLPLNFLKSESNTVIKTHGLIPGIYGIKVIENDKIVQFLRFIKN
ncbi:MAG: T9SS type A sorting domain-containing protein [Bacteroidia bacterium]|nr:T9SS type A sorting domain-containing protein [Bacteroidia bacterium]